LGIAVNPQFGGELIAVDTAPDPLVLASGAVPRMTVRVVGPTQANLAELREEWQAWLDDHADDIASGDPLLAAMADGSVPNLSSIMLLVEAEGKRLLLTGDGRGDHLLQGLAQAGLLDDEGCIHVDLFKLPHHGSDRNATRQFFRKVTADQYVVSADGLYGNPDLVTFVWLVEAAREQGRQIEIIITNETESSRKLLQEYDPEEYGYRLTKLGEGEGALIIDLAPPA
jgi:beta-lactamase superfamily II metal-dependent hydrolase